MQTEHEQLTLDHAYAGKTATSRAAAASIVPRTGTQRRRVFEFIARYVYATDQEIQDGLNMSESSERPRRLELLEAGLIEAHTVKGTAVTRRTRSGHEAQLWRVSTLGATLLQLTQPHR